MPRFFGTDGIRGKAGEFPLEKGALSLLGRTLAELLNSRLQCPARAVIGRDTRESGPWIESALAAGLRTAGAEAVSAGVITTPGVAYLTRTGGFDVGVVISASHNSYEDNGIKLFTPSGRKFDEADEEILEARLLNDESGGVESSDPLEPSIELSDRYFKFLLEEIAAGLDLKGMKIALDCANGAAFSIAPRLFAQLGASVDVIGCKPDGKNINEQCGSLHLAGLQKKARECGADIGIAFDGDADRALFADERGEIVDGDRILLIMAEHYMQKGLLDPKIVVSTVMSNIGLELALRARNIEMRRTPVGDKYVLDELLQSGAIVGGEQSGHIIFPKVSLAGDGIITALQTLHAMAAQKKSLAQLLAGFETYPQILVNVLVKSKPPFDSVPAIRAAAEQLERELEGQGRLLLRYSGTEKLARVMIEGRDQNKIIEQAHGLAEVIRREIG